MRLVLKCWLIAFSFLSSGTVRAWEAQRILDLKEIFPVEITVQGKRVLLVVTGAPPHILTFTNLAPSSLKRPNEAGAGGVQVTYGKDWVGLARVLVARANPGVAITSVSLTFDTEDQAAATVKALRPRDRTPSPPRRKKDGR